MSDEYAKLIELFESGELKEESFRHREHLIVCLWYLERYSELDAILRIKHGIMKYNLIFKAPQANDRGYHETITMFFIQLAQRFRETLDPALSFSAKADLFISAYPQFRPLMERYYSKDSLRSETARKFWMAPERNW